MSQEEFNVLVKQNTKHLFILVGLILAVGALLILGHLSNRSDIDTLKERVLGARHQ